MVGSLVKFGGDKGVVIDAADCEGHGILYKIKWLPPMLGPSADSWLDIKNNSDIKVLVRVEG